MLGSGYLLLFPDLSAILSLELEVPSSLAEFLMNSKQRYFGGKITDVHWLNYFYSENVNKRMLTGK